MAAVDDGDTIVLLKNVDYYGEISIINETVTIDLNGFILNVITETGAPIGTVYVENGELAIADSVGGGELNVDSRDFYGVFVYNGKATVTSIKSSFALAAINIENGGEVTVTGDVTVTSGHEIHGAYVNGGGTVKVDGAFITDASHHILLDGGAKSPGGYELSTTLSGYYTYTDGSNTVWIKDTRHMVCEIVGGARYTDFADALTATVDGDTVVLLEDIDYYGYLTIIDKTVTIDLNGFTLYVESHNEGPEESAIYVKNGGLILADSEGGGELNVISYDFFGVYVDDAKAIVTNVSNSVGLAALRAENGGEIIVTGDVTAANSESGAWANGGSTITVDGAFNIVGSTVHVVVGGAPRAEDSIWTPTTKSGYITYTNGGDSPSTVWIKDTAPMVCEVDGFLYPSFADAILALADGSTVKLLTDVTYEGVLQIKNKVVTFDLNGYTVTVNAPVSPNLPGLLVEDGKLLLTDGSMEGDGEFNVVSLADFGVKVLRGEATVTNVTVDCLHAALWAEDGSELIVKGDVTILDKRMDNFSVAWAYVGSTVRVDGDVTGMDDDPKYIMLGVTSWDGWRVKMDFTKTTMPGYLTYADAIGNTVWLKDNGPYVCEIDGAVYSYLKGALFDVRDGDTIILLDDIEFKGQLVIVDKEITFDLNGFILNVVTTGTDIILVGVDVKNGKLLLEDNSMGGGGELNVINGTHGHFGVRAENAEVTVTNVTSYRGYAALYVVGSGTITVTGDLTATDTDDDFSAAWVYGGGTVTIEGTTSVPDGRFFMKIGSAAKTMSDNTASSKAGYHEYSDDTNTVWLKRGAVTDITDVQTFVIRGTPLTLTGTVLQGDGYNWFIVWELDDAGTTGATVVDGVLSVTGTGVAKVKATVVDGLGAGSDLVETFDVTVFVQVTNITGVPDAAVAGTDLPLTGTVTPSDADNATIVWSIKTVGGTGATLEGNVLSTQAAGTVVVTATIANGLSPSTNYVQDFSIEVECCDGTCVDCECVDCDKTGEGECCEPAAPVCTCSKCTECDKCTEADCECAVDPCVPCDCPEPPVCSCEECDVCGLCITDPDCEVCDPCVPCDCPEPPVCSCEECDVCNGCIADPDCEVCDPCVLCDCPEAPVCSCEECSVCGLCITDPDCEVCDPCDDVCPGHPVHSVTVGGGAPTVTSGIAGTQVTLTPGPAPEGKVFKEWNVLSGGVTITGNTFTIGDSDVNIEAVWWNLYVPTSGATGEWKKDSGGDFVITSDVLFNKFLGVRLNGDTVDPSNYSAASGSTIVTLKSAYLQGLPAGNHVFDLVFSDGIASSALKISPADGGGGGNGMMIAIVAAVLIAGIGAAVYFFVLKKQ